MARASCPCFERSTNTVVYGDPQSGMPDEPYDWQQWLDNNQDGDTDDAGEHAWPVAYKRDVPGGPSKLRVSAQFVLSQSWYGGGILVRATAPDGISIPATLVYSGEGNVVSLYSTDASTAFPQTAKHYNDFELYWEASSDGGTTWTHVGTSANDLYLTWHAPGVSRLYHTLVHLGSHNANGIGGTDAGPVVSAIWADFSDRDTRRVDGTQMVYYGPYALTEPPPDDVFTTRGLLSHADGRCAAWNNLYDDVLMGQGITSASIQRITTKDIPGGTGDGFDVKATLPAQGNASPHTAFKDHGVVLLGTTIYDPSYGTQFANLTAWEDASLSLLWYRNASGISFSAPNTLGDEQTQMAPA